MLYDDRDIKELIEKSMAINDELESDPISCLYSNNSLKEMSIFDIITNNKRPLVWGRVESDKPLFVGLYQIRRYKNGTKEVLLSAIKTNDLGQYFFDNVEEGEYIIRHL